MGRIIRRRIRNWGEMQAVGFLHLLGPLFRYFILAFRIWLERGHWRPRLVSDFGSPLLSGMVLLVSSIRLGCARLDRQST